jgi:carbamoyl-phosphate synthase large subunit
MLQDFLPGRNLSWNALYRHGELTAVAAMERKSYVLGGQIISGVSGQTGHGVTIDPDDCREIADRVIRAIDPTPHGFYGVDLREDADGRPRVTEVNARLAGRPLLYTASGVNLALAALRCHAGEPTGDAVRPEGSEVGLHIFRGIDIEPLVGRPGGGSRFFSGRSE